MCVREGRPRGVTKVVGKGPGVGAEEKSGGHKREMRAPEKSGRKE